MDIEEKYGIERQIYQCLAYNMKPLILMSKDIVNEVSYQGLAGFKTSEEIESELKGLRDGSLIVKYRGVNVYEVGGVGICKVVVDMSL